ncbi:hypothetical protein [Oligosphaera ethanolica]|uniref:Firmicu-CTERM sorting domain-containing protein n=1 Tax=Oligosphaera ethanolica TaxID=760260 RepID=A0AAE4ANT9_9BACT|nr:hypothetical protein [Oligosphaera ethanolica]MDQ0289243.1 hypothetical protein [Oligosphaera ethanolica]
MRTKVLVLVLALMAMPVFAVFQYEIVTGPFGVGGVGIDPGIKGMPYYVRITEGTGSIYIADRIDDLKKMSGNKELLSITAEMSSPEHYGWADMSSGKAVVATGKTQEILVAKGTDGPIIKTGYELGTFTVGDQFGVWLTPNDQKFTGATIFGKDNPINSPELVYRKPFIDTDATGTAYHELSFKGTGSNYFTIYGVGEEGPSGKPLPGVLATLLIGGAISGAAGMKKRRRQKA